MINIACCTTTIIPLLTLEYVNNILSYFLKFLQFSRLAQALFTSNCHLKLLTMNNTLRNYQPDNRIFWQLLAAVLCFVFCVLYTTYRVLDHGDLSWHDWCILGILSLPVTFLFTRMVKERQS